MTEMTAEDDQSISHDERKKALAILRLRNAQLGHDYVNVHEQTSSSGEFPSASDGFQACETIPGRDETRKKSVPGFRFRVRYLSRVRRENRAHASEIDRIARENERGEDPERGEKIQETSTQTCN